MLIFLYLRLFIYLSGRDRKRQTEKEIHPIAAVLRAEPAKVRSQKLYLVSHLISGIQVCGFISKSTYAWNWIRKRAAGILCWCSDMGFGIAGGGFIHCATALVYFNFYEISLIEIIVTEKKREIQTERDPPFLHSLPQIVTLTRQRAGAWNFIHPDHLCKYQRPKLLAHLPLLSQYSGSWVESPEAVI